MTPEVDTTIEDIVHRFNRSRYLNISACYEPPGPDGERRLALIIALAFGEDKDELDKKDLREIDGTIRVMEASPHVLVGPDVWELWE